MEDLINSIQAKANISAVILFGSYAKGAAAKKSDIDVLVVGKVKTGIDKIAKEIYAKYGKEINMVMMASNEFKKQRDKAIIREIVNNHYVLHGAEKFVNLAFK
ncbi:nucleotidyltransferase domain-containing protein [Candidatus Woesearchaeota archaeon]|nr:nucleotidyltransferase domain-containing protein [Candidatus Woesearchaeota archaeon]